MQKYSQSWRTIKDTKELKAKQNAQAMAIIVIIFFTALAIKVITTGNL